MMENRPHIHSQPDGPAPHPASAGSPLDVLSVPKAHHERDISQPIATEVRQHEVTERGNTPLAESPVITGLDYGIKYGAAFGGIFALMAAMTENTTGLRGSWTTGNPLEVGVAIFALCVITGALSGLNSRSKSL